MTCAVCAVTLFFTILLHVALSSILQLNQCNMLLGIEFGMIAP